MVDSRESGAQFALRWPGHPSGSSGGLKRSRCPVGTPWTIGPEAVRGRLRAALLALVLLHVLRPGNRSQALPSPCEKSGLREHRQLGPAMSGEPLLVPRPPRVRSLYASSPTWHNKTLLPDLRRKRLRRAASLLRQRSAHVEPEGHFRTQAAGDSRAGPNPIFLHELIDFAELFGCHRPLGDCSEIRLRRIPMSGLKLG